MELNREKAARHARVLEAAADAWFYGWHVSDDDMNNIENALAFFTHNTELLRERKAEETV